MEQNIPSRIIKKRGRLLESGKSNAYRLVHGAGDGFKGFHLDRLGDYLLASKEGKPDLAEEEIARGWMSRLKSRGVYLKQLQNPFLQFQCRLFHQFQLLHFDMLQLIM